MLLATQGPSTPAKKTTESKFCFLNSFFPPPRFAFMTQFITAPTPVHWGWRLGAPPWSHLPGTPSPSSMSPGRVVWVFLHFFCFVFCKVSLPQIFPFMQNLDPREWPSSPGTPGTCWGEGHARMPRAGH